MSGYGPFFSVPRKRSSVPIFIGKAFPNGIATAGDPLFTLQEYSFIISACSQYHVKGQPRFPFQGQNSFPFAPMKTEQKTSSGNRAQAPLPEPFYSQKQSPGPYGKHAGAIWETSREPFSGAELISSWEPFSAPSSHPFKTTHHGFKTP